MVTLILAFRLSTLLLILPLLAGGQDASTAESDASPPGTEAAALLRLKASFKDPANALEAWSPSSPPAPCNATNPWPGVQCYKGSLIGLRLAHLNLSGAFDFAALANLPGLHAINLKRNNFAGPLPASLATVRSLRALYLSHNGYTGPVPGDVFANMRWLKKLYLDHNELSGVLPAAAIAGAPRLQELHLEHNKIEGPVPERLPASLRLFNVSHNRLTGMLPRAVVTRFNESAFAGNHDLCGAPGSDAGACEAVAAPEPSQPPMSASDYFAVEEETSIVVVIGIILLVIALVSGAMVLMLQQDEQRNSATPPYYDTVSTGAGMAPKPAAMAAPRASDATMEMGGSSHAGGSGSGAGGGRRMDEFVLMNKSCGVFGLPDMMKASAEVLGNGTLGSAYKAAMRNGITVAVKRMRDMNRVGREEFENHIRTLCELRHPNVLSPLGYHYRKEEKLIVSEFMQCGSLLYVLHGDQSPSRVILDWPTRLRIALGVARGMAYLHEKLGIPSMRFASMDGADFDAPPPPPPHGNLKSGNILLDAKLEPHVVDYGFFPLVNAPQLPQSMFAYRSPEAASAQQQQQQRVPVSARSDVYCFGVVLLELVTGRFPSQYLLNARGGTDVVNWAASAVTAGSEREILDPVIAAAGGASAVQLVRIAVECTEAAPESRPNMAEAARMVEEVAGAS
ncbi:pollen receptor-like kinase 3 [Lolium rigidum]|uniref:pollen receptor-like kinase 3 n=1 Tax=Lolium rigidum TaxID=89674 RepID=UPI001F5C8A29|nr:pollen receptor-like kinase 3 [Lolium rigidum]